LDIDGTQVTANGFSALVSLPKLETLHVSSDQMNDFSIERLKTLSSLKYLFVHGDDPSGLLLKVLTDALSGERVIMES
jgi:hypothetical protein